ncbi:MAG: phosphoribosylformylglycinamidine synthase I [Planctomycetota bacterium]
MTAPRVLIFRSAGTNCDAESVAAFEAAGAEVSLRHLNAVLETPQVVREANILCFPGGFTYGDDIASGAVFAGKLRHRLLPELLSAVEGGTLVLGICNGFQILVRAGLLPVTEAPGTPGETALGFNDSARFEARWVDLEGGSDDCPWIRRGEVIRCPVAHGEGKFVVRDEATLSSLEANGQIAVRYRMPEGTAAGTYPFNPNGSVDDIAGICDPTGRVLGMMPHPERNALPWHHPAGTRRPPPEDAGGGLRIFENAVRWAREHA